MYANDVWAANENKNKRNLNITKLNLTNELKNPQPKQSKGGA